MEHSPVNLTKVKRRLEYNSPLKQKLINSKSPDKENLNHLALEQQQSFRVVTSKIINNQKNFSNLNRTKEELQELHMEVDHEEHNSQETQGTQGIQSYHSRFATDTALIGQKRHFNPDED